MHLVNANMGTTHIHYHKNISVYSRNPDFISASNKVWGLHISVRTNMMYKSA